MKRKVVLLLILSFFTCLGVFAQQAKNARQEAPSSTELKSEIQQLKAENERLEGQLQRLEKEVDIYRVDFGKKCDELNDNMSHWLAVLCGIISLIGVALGVVAPIIVNHSHDAQLRKSVKTLGTQVATLSENVSSISGNVTSVSEQAKNAGETVQKAMNEFLSLKIELEDIKKVVSDDSNKVKEALDRIVKLEKNINKKTNAAEEAATEAKASQLFAEALAEEDNSKKIELYTEYLKLKPKNAPAFNNRGVAKNILGDKNGAIGDFDKAIELKPDYAAAYNNRGNAKSSLGDYMGAIKDYDKAIEINPQKTLYYRNRARWCYRKLAETETDETKKTEYLAKAEADEKKAESLK